MNQQTITIEVIGQWTSTVMRPFYALIPHCELSKKLLNKNAPGKLYYTPKLVRKFIESGVGINFKSCRQEDFGRIRYDSFTKEEQATARKAGYNYIAGEGHLNKH